MKFNLDIFKMGYFIKYKNSGGKFGNAIEKRQILAGFSPQQAIWTHIEVSGGGCHSINISPPISKLIDITKTHKGKTIQIVRYRNEDYEQKGRYKVAYFSASLCNKGYDIPGILAFIFKWIKQSNRLFFCSEGCAWSLQREYPQVKNGMPPNEWMPAHFSGDDFEVVWEGVIE